MHLKNIIYQESFEFDNLSRISSIFGEIIEYFAKQNRSFKKYSGKKGCFCAQSASVRDYGEVLKFF